jgi:4-amino-4-deoxychorismate lyase
MATLTSPLIWVNAERCTTLSALDRGLAYGDGLFETCRLQQGELPLWPWHRTRLLNSARALGIELPADTLQASLAAVLKSLPALEVSAGTCKIILTRGAGGRGYQLPARASATLVILVYPDQLNPLASASHPARVRVCHMRLGRNRVLAGHKHLNRLENVMARAEWRDAEFDEGLLLDEQSNVIEATAHNLFAFWGGRWHTPSLHAAGVAGVMRQILLERLIADTGQPPVVGQVTLAQLLAADELMLCNSNRGLTEVASLYDGQGAHLQSYHSTVHTAALRQTLHTFMHALGKAK